MPYEVRLLLYSFLLCHIMLCLVPLNGVYMCKVLVGSDYASNTNEDHNDISADSAGSNPLQDLSFYRSFQSFGPIMHSSKTFGFPLGSSSPIVSLNEVLFMQSA